MPESVETDLGKLENKIKDLLKNYNEVKLHSFETQKIAFGLKALIVTLGWPENLEIDDFETKLEALKGVNSVQIIDFRRSLG